MPVSDDIKQQALDLLKKANVAGAVNPARREFAEFLIAHPELLQEMQMTKAPMQTRGNVVISNVTLGDTTLSVLFSAEDFSAISKAREAQSPSAPSNEGQAASTQPREIDAVMAEALVSMKGSSNGPIGSLTPIMEDGKITSYQLLRNGETQPELVTFTADAMAIVNNDKLYTINPPLGNRTSGLTEQEAKDQIARDMNSDAVTAESVRTGARETLGQTFATTVTPITSANLTINKIHFDDEKTANAVIDRLVALRNESGLTSKDLSFTAEQFSDGILSDTAYKAGDLTIVMPSNANAAKAMAFLRENAEEIQAAVRESVQPARMAQNDLTQPKAPATDIPTYGVDGAKIILAGLGANDEVDMKPVMKDGKLDSYQLILKGEDPIPAKFTPEAVEIMKADARITVLPAPEERKTFVERPLPADLPENATPEQRAEYNKAYYQAKYGVDPLPSPDEEKAAAAAAAKANASTIAELIETAAKREAALQDVTPEGAKTAAAAPQLDDRMVTSYQGKTYPASNTPRPQVRQAQAMLEEIRLVSKLDNLTTGGNNSASVVDGKVDPNKMDGIPGPKFDSALKTFQTEMGLEATGIPDEKTMAALEKVTSMNRNASLAKAPEPLISIQDTPVIMKADFTPASLPPSAAEQAQIARDSITLALQDGISAREAQLIEQYMDVQKADGKISDREMKQFDKMLKAENLADLQELAQALNNAGVAQAGDVSREMATSAAPGPNIPGLQKSDQVAPSL